MSEEIVTVLDWIAILCLLAGALLSVVAAVGLIRFPDLLSRMHTAAKPQVLGMLLVLVGIGLRLVPVEETNVFNVGTLLLVGLFQIVTIPVAGHIAARVGYRTGRIREDLLVHDELGERLARKREEDAARSAE
ncbi:monovalent cation/H(+) antiporter subunit G [Nocardiopsis changdeensis]|uniref:Monovalent cation/H(+) antiporter subunit G n=1 Tax=Nocardiopsis changdeensis TaxID=2831969 RepID=A0ABX8BLZ8_9ACTN|nr:MULTISPECIES: monovalent cation/H(+) antiporter subunit G [Nocardiopsis]QUX22334.1 monovalent cation/H(+) antiporter subunit G [Nocardiopsis changdeensis]QYX38275.1 monovalent cation/H(+) antiporter subunit G [Nocardiopsis sp. MT53]